MLLKDIPLIQMFPNRIHMMKMKSEVIRSLVNSESSTNDSNLNLDTLSMEIEERVEAMTFSL